MEFSADYFKGRTVPGDLRPKSRGFLADKGFEGTEADTVQKLSKIIEKRMAHTLVKMFFGIELSPKQTLVVRKIAYLESRRLCINAYTRYGKSFAIAIGVALLILINPDPLRIRLVAPTGLQAKIIRDYIADMVARCPVLAAKLEDAPKSVGESLRKEASKERLVFNDGKDLLTLSASGDGNRLMGHGADVLIVDEACLIPRSIYLGKVMRMLGDNPEKAVLVESSNPWDRDSVYYDHWNDENFERIHVGWDDGVKEGRTTIKYMDEMRKSTPPILWTVLYDSLFPEEANDQLIRLKWVEDAKRRAVEWRERKTTKDNPDPPIVGVWYHGLDVAEAGMDFTVLTDMVQEVPDDIEQSLFHVTKIQSWHKADTMETAKTVMMQIEKDEVIGVDVIGVGKGVGDRLNEEGYDVLMFKASYGLSDEAWSKPDKDRFNSWHDAAYWWLRDLMEKGQLALHECPPELQRDLMRLKYKIGSTGKIQVYVEAGMLEGRKNVKSPDWSSSLSITVFCAKRREGVHS